MKVSHICDSQSPRPKWLATAVKIPYRRPCGSSLGFETFEFRDIVACNILQHSATFCNNFYFLMTGFFELPEFIFGIGFALFLRDCGISVERAEILYTLLE